MNTSKRATTVRPPTLADGKTSGPILLYKTAARLIGPSAMRLLLKRRAARGKEAPERLEERFGVASAPRPVGDVIWLHAASVGESLSLLPLIEAILAERPELYVVLTTGTLRSAELMSTRLPEGAFHQFAPVDTPQAISAFLDHWRPSVYGVVESELWPVALSEARARGIKTLLLSARMSAKSARNWGFAPRSISALLDMFDAILAQNHAIGDRLARLGAAASRLQIGGALKDAAAPLSVDQSDLDYWRMQLAGRIAWIAASTHPGEEALAFAAHKRIAAERGRALLIVAPRHPERAGEVREAAEAAGLSAVLRSRDVSPGPKDDVLIVDRMGELGLWYRVAPYVFLGGSVAPVGGHNPLEPARLGVALAYGPGTESCQESCERLEAAGGAVRLQTPDAETLAAEILAMVGPDARPTAAAKARAEAAQRVAEEGGKSLELHLDAVLNLLDTSKSAQ